MWFRRNETAKGARAGFVLLEVLVAVGVAAALMAVLIRSFSQTWSRIGMVREEAEGAMIGRSMLADAAMPGRLSPGTQEGVVGRYAWKITTVMQQLQPPPQKKKQQPQQQQQQQDPQGSQSGNQVDPDQDQGADNKPARPPDALYHVVIVLKGPSGRSNRLDTFALAPPP
jgi:hypothetical protein